MEKASAATIAPGRSAWRWARYAAEGLLTVFVLFVVVLSLGLDSIAGGPGWTGVEVTGVTPGSLDGATPELIPVSSGPTGNTAVYTGSWHGNELFISAPAGLYVVGESGVTGVADGCTTGPPVTVTRGHTTVHAGMGSQARCADAA